MTSGNKLVTGLVAGAVIGSAIGLLVAPKTGKESRQMVAEGALHWRNKAGGAVGTLWQKVRKESQIGAVEGRSNEHVVTAK